MVSLGFVTGSGMISLQFNSSSPVTQSNIPSHLYSNGKHPPSEHWNSSLLQVFGAFVGAFLVVVVVGSVVVVVGSGVVVVGSGVVVVGSGVVVVGSVVVVVGSGVVVVGSGVVVVGSGVVVVGVVVVVVVVVGDRVVDSVVVGVV